MSITFFYANGGFSYDPAKETKEDGKLRCAHELAVAETHAHEMDWTFEWVDDSDGWRDAEKRVPKVEEVLYCQLFDRDGNVLASLCGIEDPTHEYRRVVEAELALEAMNTKGDK